LINPFCLLLSPQVLRLLSDHVLTRLSKVHEQNSLSHLQAEIHVEGGFAGGRDGGLAVLLGGGGYRFFETGTVSPHLHLHCPKKSIPGQAGQNHIVGEDLGVSIQTLNLPCANPSFPREIPVNYVAVIFSVFFL